MRISVVIKSIVETEKGLGSRNKTYKNNGQK